MDECPARPGEICRGRPCRAPGRQRRTASATRRAGRGGSTSRPSSCAARSAWRWSTRSAPSSSPTPRSARSSAATPVALVGHAAARPAPRPTTSGRIRTGIAERRMRHLRGHDLWAVVSAVPLPEAGDSAMLVCLDDATSRRNTERMLVHAALHDSLTNLPNRRLLRDRLDTALARAQRSLSTRRGALRRPRPLQGRQRHLRPRRRRRGAGRRRRRHPLARCGRATRWPGSAVTSSSSCARTCGPSRT